MSSALVDRFVQHIKRLQFVDAEKLLRSEWGDVTCATSSPPFLIVLLQLASAESQYFNFAYLASKFFRKENNLRDIYAQIRLELDKIGTAEQLKWASALALKDDSDVDIGDGGIFPDIETINKFSTFSSIRANLVEFYSLLPGKEWRAFDTEQFRHLMTTLGQLSNDDNELFMHCRRELVVLQLFLNAQLAIQQCNLLDALVLLSRTRALLDDWFRSLDARQALSSAATRSARPSSSSSSASAFLLATLGLRRRPSFCRLGLLQFLLQCHQLLVAKFSLYFHDTLVTHASHGEMRQAFSMPNSFLQLFQTFVRKANSHTICLLVNRIDQSGSFQGFGYHYDDTSEDEDALPPSKCLGAGFGRAPEAPRPTTTITGRRQLTTTTSCSGKISQLKMQSGLADKYPALLFMPPERRSATIGGGGGGGAAAAAMATITGSCGGAHLRGSEYATICAFVQEGCCGLSGGVVDGGAAGGSSSNDKLTESGKIRYLYDRNKDQTFFTACVEANIHLVVTFERRVQERESTVHAFFNDVLNGLRGTKLFQQEIKTFGK